MTYEAGSNRDIIPLLDRYTDSMGEKGTVEGGSSTDHTTTGVSVCISARLLKTPYRTWPNGYALLHGCGSGRSKEGGVRRLTSPITD